MLFVSRLSQKKMYAFVGEAFPACITLKGGTCSALSLSQYVTVLNG